MHWRVRRIVNGCAAQQLVARRDVIAPEFISYGLVIRAINRKVCLRRAVQTIHSSRRRFAARLNLGVRHKGKTMTPTENLERLGLTLPNLSAPDGSYVHATRSGEKYLVKEEFMLALRLV